jgi:hypothetical protein
MAPSGVLNRRRFPLVDRKFPQRPAHGLLVLLEIVGKCWKCLLTFPTEWR